MEQKEIVQKLIEAASLIENSRTPKANYVHLSETYIQSQADERGISFEEMLDVIRKELSN